MNWIRHIIIVTLALVILVGLPVVKFGYPARLISGADTISSATVIVEAPSGGYVALINKDIHTDPDKLKQWETFFSGGEIDYIFEDLSCMVAASDENGLEMAKSLQSRLPENQMNLRIEDSTLLFSKVFYGFFDVVVISDEVLKQRGGEQVLFGKDIKSSVDMVYGRKDDL